MLEEESLHKTRRFKRVDGCSWTDPSRIQPVREDARKRLLTRIAAYPRRLGPDKRNLSCATPHSVTRFIHDDALKLVAEIMDDEAIQRLVGLHPLGESLLRRDRACLPQQLA